MIVTILFSLLGRGKKYKTQIYFEGIYACMNKAHAEAHRNLKTPNTNKRKNVFFKFPMKPKVF